MAVIPQQWLYKWTDVDGLGDLERLDLLMKNLPDEKLMRTLERERDKGRDDYPVRPTWNSILAGIVFGHKSIQDLRRELSRNGQLRELCGFNPLLVEKAVPSPSAYTRFLKRLLAHADLVGEMFDTLVERLRELLPEFGKVLAIDGKALGTHARPRKGDEPAGKPDGRRDTDADWGVKTYHGTNPDGTAWEEVKKWFGYRVHLIVDTKHELPVAFAVTRASAAEAPQAHRLLDGLKQRHPGLLDACEILIADKGYDDGKLYCRLWDEEGIKPVIAIRRMWRRGEGEDEGTPVEALTRRVNGTRNVLYNCQGEVQCVCMKTGAKRPMAYGGFEEDRGTLKYRCPARHYGSQCASYGECPAGKAVRIKLAEDRRVFTPIARSSYTWGRTYKKRTAVERVNSRLDVSYGFEQHFIRGLAKMQLRMGLALAVMLGIAVGRIKQRRLELMRSLVKSA